MKRLLLLAALFAAPVLCAPAQYPHEIRPSVTFTGTVLEDGKDVVPLCHVYAYSTDNPIVYNASIGLTIGEHLDPTVEAFGYGLGTLQMPYSYSQIGVDAVCKDWATTGGAQFFYGYAYQRTYVSLTVHKL